MDDRGLHYADRQKGRYWWHRWHEHNYVPMVIKSLTEEEWQVLDEWFSETDVTGDDSGGELTIPGISLLAGLITGCLAILYPEVAPFVALSIMLFALRMRYTNRPAFSRYLLFIAGVAIFLYGQ